MSWYSVVSDEITKLREALSEIAGISSQRGMGANLFSIDDYKRLGEIEQLARRTLHDDPEG